MELNETNVQAIFNRCSKTKKDGSTEWNEEALKKNRANIRYLMGQLALVHEVHEFIEDHEIDRAFAKRYGGKLWTVNDELPMDLFRMGGQSNFCFPLEGHRVLLMLNKLKPTLSPQDPKFASWWESADGLVIRAKAAEDEDKLDEALFLYEKAAKMGDADAQYKCGVMYYDEYGVMYCDNGTRSLDKALYWYEKAARQGNVDAQYICGGMYNCGEGTAKNTARALYWFEKAAERGHAECQFICGEMYKDGEGVAADPKKALYWYEKAAEQDIHRAQYLRGLMYYCGEGTAVDKKKALYWCEKLAGLGYNDCQFICGKMYEDGNGIAADPKKALYWYESAAEQGCAKAQFQCGCMYGDGVGTARNRDKAKEWFQKAALQTDDILIRGVARKVLREYF